ncbi:carbohydrate-binding family 9-like protein [Lunatimonas salinarum]|uniref:carbohydrate-binding family 9-like protein n=1 Tax=Lunatimonas salinarum TaxID=1774590 RepID=UPI001FD7402D|nr:carbohydrate-binding family 9-like protein [Lunatimonas salinarum]
MQVKPALVYLLFATWISPMAWAQTESVPLGYVAYQTPEKPLIDGKLNDKHWESAQWSEAFVDIQGDTRLKPAHLTRMKMMWDEHYFYIGVKLDEPHLWATYTERESVIFHENDIEVFLDPDGDTHNYYEWEINALGTLWDLLLTKPYKDGGKPLNGWNINDFEYAVYLEGTLNDPRDEDDYWSVEMAIPWSSLSYPRPKDGNQWRINFSRVQWRLEVENNTYKKVINPATEKSYPEDNWVWSPQGVINMHVPDRWGYVQFSELEVGSANVAFEHRPDEKVKTQLRDYYDAQKAFFRKNLRYAVQPNELQMTKPAADAEFEVTKTRFKISLPSLEEAGKRWYIVEDGRIWKQ